MEGGYGIRKCDDVGIRVREVCGKVFLKAYPVLVDMVVSVLVCSSVL